MFKHYLKTAFRYLYRNRSITLINVIGLALSIAIFILIVHYVQNELKYDKFNQNIDHVGRLEFTGSDGNTRAWTTSAMGYDVVEGVPEATGFVRVQFWDDIYLDYNERKYQIGNVMLTDSNFFDLFDVELIQGNPATALTEPFSVVLNQSTAAKIFGDKDPMGEILKTSSGRDYMVTGVIRDPENFHLQFDAMISFVTLKEYYGEEHLYTYRTYQSATYFKIIQDVHIDTVNKKVNRLFHEIFARRYNQPEDSIVFTAGLRPFEEVYFARHVSDMGTRHGNKQFVIIFMIIAGFIIAIACINYINLSTARATLRAMEVGIKKVAGCDKRKLIFQFLGESMLITFIATLLGLLTVELLFPVFERIIGDDLRIAYLENPYNLLLVVAGIIVVGLLAGLYPAFYLTRFQPASVLKGEKTRSRSAGFLRKALIIFQFSISMILIIGTIVVYNQVNYLRKKDLGFNKEHIVTIGLNNEITNSREIFKENLLRYPLIRKVAYSYTVPGSSGNYETFDIDGQSFNPNVYTIDPDYVDLMGMETIRGRNFSWDLETDRLNTCLINETGVRRLDMDIDSVVGKRFLHPSWYITAFPVTQFEIIGVLKDFHFKSLRTPIEPLIFGWNDEWFGYVNVKISSENIGEALNIIEKEWKNISPQYPFEYSFMDENFDRMYRSDQKLGEVFRYFAGFAIFIAIMGLFGLAAFIAEQRTKEICIRKVMGATVSRISLIMVKEFTILILLSSIVAWPLAWYWARNWLREFAYKAEPGITIFISATLIAILIALITVISQTIRAANTNPAKALRYE
jgi:putative ABC transport system permease protein